MQDPGQISNRPEAVLRVWLRDRLACGLKCSVWPAVRALEASDGGGVPGSTASTGSK